ncbi:YigZ family protein [Kocuria sp.]|uniref:IMPACT family protein n=1 Tax=Kocuria sp. TaxID=1871328 RepID=UPI0026DB6590|nr:YigZ family protein [Kocuria sp.]MDO4919747.1 YigZ family protein [Kocuria sp.]
MTADETAPAPPDPTASYTVLRGGQHTAEVEIRKSRFLAVLTRVETEEQARKAVTEVRDAHRDARHHCSAFVLGPSREVTRSSDDGEPSGTAGMPMLQALLQFATPTQRAAERPGDLSDVCAVVVRWFGGVKLGAGGLVRAYSGVVADALDSAPLTRRARCRPLTLTAPHADAGRVEAEIRAQGFTVLPTEYDAAGALLRVLVPDLPAQLDAACHALAGITSGTARVSTGDVSWHDVPQD